MNKKGQAAMEFIMTYGWAILVVMIIVGALAFFGALSPSAFMDMEEDNYMYGGGKKKTLPVDTPTLSRAPRGELVASPPSLGSCMNRCDTIFRLDVDEMVCVKECMRFFTPTPGCRCDE